jgi:hypothetical protein
MAWRPGGIIRAGGTAERRANGAMGATMLVVEDEPKLRDLVRSYLERAGFAVLSTGSGADRRRYRVSLARPTP